MKKNLFILKGEVVVGYESTASIALSYAKKVIEAKIPALESFTKDFDLAVDDIYVLDIEENKDRGFIVFVELDGTCTASKNELEEFFELNIYELYLNVIGLAPTKIEVQEKQLELQYT